MKCPLGLIVHVRAFSHVLMYSCVYIVSFRVIYYFKRPGQKNFPSLFPSS